MYKIHQSKITFVIEPDGEVEIDFKRELTKIFLHTRKNIRAYLVQGRYGCQLELNVMLCLKFDVHEDHNIIEACANVFKSKFSKDQYLDILVLSNEYEEAVRLVACPFYTSSGFNVS
jgi:hypothetical protein